MKQHRRHPWLLVVTTLLLLPALACSLATGSPTATPPATSTVAAATAVPEPTETVAPTATAEGTVVVTDYDSDELGITFSYPQDWELEEGAGFITVVSSTELLESEEFDQEGAGMIIAVGPADEITSASLEDALLEAAEQLPFAGEGSLVSGPTATEINGQEAASATFEAEDEETDGTLVAVVTLVRAEGQVAVAAAITLAEYAPTYESTLEAIAQSIRLRAPEGPEIPEPEGTLEYGETVSGSVSEGGASSWNFIGVAGEAVDIIATPEDEQLDLVVDILSSGGRSILENGPVDDAFGAEEIRGLELPENDVYVVLLQGFAGSEGDYRLTVSETSAASGGTVLTPGATLSGTIPVDGQQDYVFASESARPLTIIVEPEEEFDVVVELIHPQEGVVAEEDSSFGREQVRFSPEANVEYTIRLRGFAGDGGEFTISLIEGSPLGEAGSTVYASDSLAENADEGHSFPFTAVEGETVRAVVTPAGELDVIVEVWSDDSDLLLEQVDASFGVEEQEFIVPETGNYYFAVSGFDGQAGDYEITLTGSPLVIFELALGDFVEGMFGEEAFLEYGLRLDPDQTVLIAVQADPEVDAVIELLDLDENVLADADANFGGEPEELRYTAEAGSEDGTIYIIRVSEFEGLGGGAFTLTLE